MHFLIKQNPKWFKQTYVKFPTLHKFHTLVNLKKLCIIGGGGGGGLGGGVKTGQK